MMRTRRFPFIAALLCLTLLAAACGYHNPNLLPQRQGPPVNLHVPLWTGPSSEIRVAADIHNSLQDWLIQSRQVTLVSEESSAAYVLRGKILSVHSPGRSYDARDRAQSLKVVLTVEYTLVDGRTGKTVWQNRKHTLDKTYAVGSSTAQTEDNRRNALEVVANDLAEAVYIRIFRAIDKHEQETALPRQENESPPAP